MIKVKICSAIFIQVLYVLCLYKAKISGEPLQDHWSSGFISILNFDIIMFISLFGPNYTTLLYQIIFQFISTCTLEIKCI